VPVLVGGQLASSRVFSNALGCGVGEPMERGRVEMRGVSGLCEFSMSPQGTPGCPEIEKKTERRSRERESRGEEEKWFERLWWAHGQNSERPDRTRLFLLFSFVSRVDWSTEQVKGERVSGLYTLEE